MNALTPELYCTDLTISLDCYTSIFGFRILYDRPEEKFAYLERDGAELMLEQIGIGRNWMTAALEHPFGRGINFQIGVSNAEEIYERSRIHGLKIILPLETKWYRVAEKQYAGQQQFVVQDPDGYLLRFAKHLGYQSSIQTNA